MVLVSGCMLELLCRFVKLLWIVCGVIDCSYRCWIGCLVFVCCVIRWKISLFLCFVLYVLIRWLMFLCFISFVSILRCDLFFVIGFRLKCGGMMGRCVKFYFLCLILYFFGVVIFSRWLIVDERMKLLFL